MRAEVTGIDEAILLTLALVATKHKKTHYLLSQAELLELLKKEEKVSICRRTLNRHLTQLEAQGFFIRLKERKLKSGKPLFGRTFYQLTPKHWRWMKERLERFSEMLSLFAKGGKDHDIRNN